MPRIFSILLLVTSITTGFAQTPRVKYLSISSDNDYYYWFGYSTDRYYTAGTAVTYGFGADTKSKIVKALFPSLYDSAPSLFSFRLFQQINTPKYLFMKQVQGTDYPFAAALYVTASRTTVSAARRGRWKTELDIGVLGPAAGGEPTQDFFHHLINYPTVKGWNNQLPDQLVLNYQAEWEKNILSGAGNKFGNALVHAAAGTMNTFLQAGFSGSVSNQKNLMWSDVALWPNSSRWTFYAAAVPMVRWVLWNEMLEGAPFQHTSYYTVAPSSITRVLPMFVLKVAVARGRHVLMGMQTFTGREFATVDPHVYGTITYLYRLD